MSEMVERVMREIARCAPLPARTEFDSAYREAAIAAINAMRDPTEAMLNEATAFGHMMSTKDMKEYWGAMIDASISG